MAPRLCLPRYCRYYSALPRASLPENVPSIPAAVTSYISVKTFAQLFTGTVCIFIIGVLAWKVGKAIRFFSKGNVHGEGRSPYTRYARTWYGWVPWQRHEANKRLLDNLYQKYKSCTTWKSTHADYAWVWWDPGQEGLETYKRDRKLPRWLPKWLKDYEPITADTIWNPGPPPFTDLPRGDLPRYSAALDNENSVSESFLDLSRFHSTNNTICLDGATVQFSSVASMREDGLASDHSLMRKRRRIWRQRPWIFTEADRLSWSPRHLSHTRRDIPREFKEQTRWSASVPCFSTVANHQQARTWRDVKNPEAAEQYTGSCIENAPVLPRSFRKYQVWSVWMQVQPSGLIQHKQCGFIGPPGTPKSEFLISLISLQHRSSESTPTVRGNYFLTGSTSSTISSIRTYLTANSTMATGQVEHLARKWSPTPFLCSQQSPAAAAATTFVQKYELHSLHNLACLESSVRISPMMKPNEDKTEEFRKIVIPSDMPNQVPLHHLSDWEIRMIDSLDRKLDWLLCEIEPGRKPFHFPTLANHWLNKATWKVLDPCSRTPINDRRRHGDPRFNVPYLEPVYRPRHKYQTPSRRRIESPKIDSWRAAVNRERKVSGVRDLAGVVELFNSSSAGGPADGKIDPACWILRKPPQGFIMPTGQRNAYYDGIGGWQETLDDWQKVRRGYCVRKMIHEGRSNRNKLKGLIGATRRYRSTLPRGTTG